MAVAAATRARIDRKINDFTRGYRSDSGKKALKRGNRRAPGGRKIILPRGKNRTV